MERLGEEAVTKFFQAIKNLGGGILNRIKWKNSDWGAVIEGIDAEDLILELAILFNGNLDSTSAPNFISVYGEDLCCGIDVLSLYKGANTTTNAGFPDCYTLQIRTVWTTKLFKARFCDD